MEAPNIPRSSAPARRSPRPKSREATPAPLVSSPTPSGAVPVPSSRHPASAPAAMTTSGIAGIGTRRRTTADASPIPIRGRSVHRLRPIVHVAWATTATATSLSACSHAASPLPPSAEPKPKAKRIMRIAEGAVKPSQAIAAPAYPARR